VNKVSTASPLCFIGYHFPQLLLLFVFRSESSCCVGVCLSVHIEGADNSLARPGRKDSNVSVRMA